MTAVVKSLDSVSVSVTVFVFGGQTEGLSKVRTELNRTVPVEVRLLGVDFAD